MWWLLRFSVLKIWELNGYGLSLAKDQELALYQYIKLFQQRLIVTLYLPVYLYFMRWQVVTQYHQCLVLVNRRHGLAGCEMLKIFAKCLPPWIWPVRLPQSINCKNLLWHCMPKSVLPTALTNVATSCTPAVIRLINYHQLPVPLISILEDPYIKPKCGEVA